MKPRYKNINMQRRILMFGATATVALTLGGFGIEGAGAQAQTSIKFMHPENDPNLMVVVDKMSADYERQYPDVKIHNQFMENEAFKAKLPTLLQSSEAPDFFYSWGGGVLLEQARTGALMDLTPFFDADDGKLRKIYSASSINGLSFDGKIWAIPYKVSSINFFYNKELFAKANVKDEDIKTWDDFIEAIKKLKDAGIVPIAGGGGEKWPIHFYWSYLVMRNGGKEVFDVAKNGEGEGFMHPAFIKAGEQLAELGALDPFQPGFLAANWPRALGVFGDAQAAMILGFDNTEANQRLNAGDGKGLASDNIGRFAFPLVEGGGGKITDTLGGLNGWAVSKGASTQAVDFAFFLTNQENEKKLAATGTMLPVAIGADSVIDDALIAQSVRALAASTWHQNFFDQDLGASVGRVVNDVSVEIVSGQMTAEEAAKQIQEAFDFN